MYSIPDKLNMILTSGSTELQERAVRCITTIATDGMLLVTTITLHGDNTFHLSPATNQEQLFKTATLPALVCLLDVDKPVEVLRTVTWVFLQFTANNGMYHWMAGQLCNHPFTHFYTHCAARILQHVSRGQFEKLVSMCWNSTVDRDFAV